METPPLCPSCGKPLPAQAPQGLCPECLLKAGFPSGTQRAGAAAPSDFVPPSPAELAALFPQLEILECVGRGGMGAVYRARQPALDRIVALKILPPSAGRDPSFAERFTREARALARLNHPNIVAVHDFGQAGAYHYLVMEFVDGVNLRHLLTSRSLSPSEALAIVPPICDALQFAHDQGIVHRDIKPENILVGKNGLVKIADFGLAKLIGTAADPTTLTRAGDVMGTPHYMAPEQIEHPQDVDHRADIYSLGVVLYQMLTGELPIGRFGPPSRKVQVDVRLDEVVLRALEKEPELRYQQATGFKTAVETVLKPGMADGQPETNARAQGRRLVVPLKNPRLPLRCVKTNEPVKAEDLRPMRIYCYPSIIWLALLATPIAFLILYYLLGRRLIIHVPLSVKGRAMIRRGAWTGVALFVLGVAVLSLAIMMGGHEALGGGVIPLGTLLGLGLMVTGLFYGLSRGAVLRGVDVRDDEAWLAGASRAFLASLPSPDRASGEPIKSRRPHWPLIAVALLLFIVAVPVVLYVTPQMQPNLVVYGTVTDEATGHPIAHARVADVLYNAAPGRPPAETWTNNEGQYHLRTWREEHTISASAPEYAREVNTLLLKPFTGKTEAQMDFRLKPVPKPAEASVGIQLPPLEPAAPPAARENPPPLPTVSVVSSVREAPTNAPGRTTDFDRMESNPEILRLQLAHYRQNLAMHESRYKVGLSTDMDLNDARLAIELVEAKLADDRLRFAQAQVASARKHREMIEARYSVGIGSNEELGAARLDFETATIRLREAEQKAKGGDAPTP